MPFDWQNAPSTSTPVSAENLEASAAQSVSEAIWGRQASGRYYYPIGLVQSASALTINQLVAFPIPIGRTVTLDRICVNIATLAASSTVRLGIYNDTNGLPDSLLLEAGTADSTTTGAKELTISQSVNPGWIWLAGAAQGGTPQVARWAGLYGPQGFVNSTQTNSALMSGVIHSATVSGALPATFLPTTAGQPFVITIRVA